MTQEQKARAYDEALERARKIHDQILNNELIGFPDQIREIFPQLRESEDERIRKWIKKEIEDKYVVEGIVNNKLADEAFGWLEKQKHLYETTKDRFYREGFEEGQLYEKQKDASKAIEAVDRIDKYIDENVANAHDMKNSNPDKKYYRGWDDALGAMAGILIDVYSNDKQKGRKPILEVFGFKVGDAVRLKDGDGRKHIIKSFEEVEGVHGPNFYHVEFEDNSARDGIYPGEEYPNGYYTQMEKFEEEQKPADLSEMMVHKEPYIAPVPTPMVTDEQKHILKFKVGDKVHLEGDDVIVTITGIEEDRYLTDSTYYGPILFGAEEDIWEKIEQKPTEQNYDNRIQYASVKSGIEAFASTYSFNIESKLFPQLTKEQQQLWREEIEQAVIAGGESGIELARDNRYEENKTVEWSEEDKEMAEAVCSYLNHYKSYTRGVTAVNIEEYKGRLKTIFGIG